MRRARIALVCGLTAALVAATRGQSAPSLRFVSPAADTFLTGAVTLRVESQGLEFGAVEDVTFFADGKQVCVAPGTRPSCEWDAGAELREHALRAVARLKSGSRLVANVRTKTLAYAETSFVNRVQVNAFVTDGGRFVKGLTKDAFRLLDDNRPRTISGFSPAGSPLEVVLALDVSASMKDALDVSASMKDALDDVKVAAKTFLAGLGGDDRVTVVAFNDSMFTLARREAPREVRESVIDNLTAWGGTSLYDVIARSLDQLGRQPGRRVLVLLSDGEDQSSQATFEQVQKLVRQSDATLFGVGLGRGASVQGLKEKLEALADASGGRVLFAERSDRLEEPFAEVIADLASQYTLSFEPTLDGKTHELRVEVPGKSYRIRARKAYIASQPTAARP